MLRDMRTPSSVCVCVCTVHRSMNFTNMQMHVTTTTTIRIWNSCHHTKKTPSSYPSVMATLYPHLSPLICSPSLYFCLSQGSCKWNHAIYNLMRPSFTQLPAFGVHPRCHLHQPFVPFRWWVVLHHQLCFYCLFLISSSVLFNLPSCLLYTASLMIIHSIISRRACLCSRKNLSFEVR